MSYPNQKIVVINKKKYQGSFLQIGIEEWEKAFRELKPSTFAMYLYLASNADGYKLELSQAAVENALGIKKTAYHSGINELKAKGYLEEVKSNVYRFNAENSANAESMEEGNKVENSANAETNSANAETNSVKTNRNSANADRNSANADKFFRKNDREIDNNIYINNNINNNIDNREIEEAANMERSNKEIDLSLMEIGERKTEVTKCIDIDSILSEMEHTAYSNNIYEKAAARTDYYSNYSCPFGNISEGW